jgi:LysM repeat protein
MNMSENDEQMQELEAGLRDHIIAWQGANPDKALDSAALQRAGSDYVAGQVAGGNWNFDAADAQNLDDAQDVQGTDAAPRAAANAPDSVPEPAPDSPENPASGVVPDDSRPQTYVMRKGDTLWGISQQTGIPLEDIQAANPQITDPTKIPVGAVVNFPQARTPRASGEAAQSANIDETAGDENEQQGDSGANDSGAANDGDGFLRDLQSIAAKSPSLAAAIADRIMGALVGEAQAAESPSGMRGKKHAPPAKGAQNVQPATWESITQNINLQEVGKLLDWLGGPDTGGGSYEAQKGDTWPSIARQANIPVAALKDANPALRGRKYLPKGVKVIIPPVAPPLGTPPDDPSWNRVLPHGSVAVAPTQADSPSYIVEPGEDLLTIAEKEKIPVELLMHVNHVSAPSEVKAGDKIMFPHQSNGEMLRDWLDEKVHTPVIDIDAAVRELQKQANGENDYKKLCAHYVYDAINSGLQAQGKAPIKAEDRLNAFRGGATLEKLGYRKWTTSLGDYLPRKGDVVVIQEVLPSHPNGHMAMYDGKHWISDTVQTGPSGMWSNLAFLRAKAPFAIYRP